MIAVCMPGKIGDAIWSWVLARKLWQTSGEKVAFITSEYCALLERLCRAQAWCADFVIAHDYVLDNWGCGGQPPKLPVPMQDRYSRIIQCGFTTTPDCCLGDWICKQAGVPPGAPVSYDLGEPTGMAWDRPMPEGYGQLHPFIVLAAKGPTTFAPLFRELVAACPIRVVEIGGRGDRVGEDSVDATGLDFLVTASIIREAKAFVGMMSSQLVLANGFPIPRIAVHNGVNWDMRHVLRSEWNHYPVNPTANELLGMLGLWRGETMASSLGPIDDKSDSPPYPIVQACNAVGVEKPEDVRWVRLPVCQCATSLPRLAKFRFTYSSGEECVYSVGQCPKCRTVYWQESK